MQGYRIRHDKVDATGKVTLRYRGRLFHLGIGERAYKGRRVVLMVAGPQVRLLDEGHQLVRRARRRSDRRSTRVRSEEGSACRSIPWCWARASALRTSGTM